MRLTSSRLWLVGLVLLMTGTAPLRADLIPPGHKAVSHTLVFVDSPLLHSHRLIAMPVRGFGGHEEIQPRRPFRFSSKYGTRLYVVPRDFVPPAEVNPGQPLPFPSCDVPVSSTTSVPILSPIDSLRSTCKLVAVADDAIQVELVDHAELDSNGEPASVSKIVLPMLLISAGGVIGCYLVWRQTRRARKVATADPTAT
ncbi:hypothetical protein [Stieleria mannarensis]|uniref:hypothetical protein n=1 Tax=Stieleria mannarensis TaxID=2755585 RepID=UPI0016034C8D|nr:hypothetical protein [Rhodopirellula sp. JC639]